MRLGTCAAGGGRDEDKSFNQATLVNFRNGNIVCTK